MSLTNPWLILAASFVVPLIPLGVVAALVCLNKETET